MATYEITSPSGEIYEVNAPEGATESAVLAYAQSQFAKQQPAQEEQPIVQEQPNVASQIAAPFKRFGRSVSNVAGAVVEPALQMATGFAAKPISEIAGMAAAGRELISPQGGEPEAFKQSIAEELTYQPRTEGGQFVSQNILAPIGGAIESGAEALTSPLSGGSDIAASGLKEAALQGVGFLGVKGAPKVAAGIKEANLAKQAMLKEQKATNLLRDRVRYEGQKIGLIAPAEGAAKETLSKIGGADATISMKNRSTITNKLSEEVGLNKGAISDADITKRINELSSDYSIVEKALGKEVNITPKFKTEVDNMLQSMKNKYQENPSVFKGYEGAINTLEQQLALNKLTPSTLMDSIKKLRENARNIDKNPSASIMEIDLAKTNYKLAGLYEDMIEQSLGNKKALLEKFRDSRTKLSKLHVIDSSRMTDGLIDPQKLASVVGKYGDSKRMVSGNLKIAADFANTFKNVTKPITRSELPTASRWEAMMALGAGAGIPASGGASLLLAAPMAARTVAPMLGERGLLQGKVPSYDISAMRRIAPQAAQTGMLGAAFSPYVKEEQQ